MSSMSNNYRDPTEAETEACKKAINEALPKVYSISEGLATIRGAIESVLGPFVYERLDGGRCRATQCTPDESGTQIRFLINADLD